LKFLQQRSGSNPLIANSEREGFGVTVADILSAPSTPACASCAVIFQSKAYALEFLQQRYGSNPSIANSEREGFAFQPSASCFGLPGRLRVARRVLRRNFSRQGLRLEIFQATLRFKSLNLSLIFNLFTSLKIYH
jgi:hypothetical protein